MKKGEIAVFLIVVLSIWAVVHAYVFWRLASVPWVAAHVPRPALLLGAVALWASYFVARILEGRGLDAVAVPLEFAAALWIGTVFLLFAALLATDVVTLGGWLFPRLAPALRGSAALAALGLAVVAIVQGLRPPVVHDEEVRLAGLPRERDGLVVVAVSDLHLGTLLGGRWLGEVVRRIDAAKPDAVVIVGDLIDGDVARVEPLVPELRTLRAPLGVWAVTGNHDYYAGADASVRLFEEAGFRVLRDGWAEVAPGLVFAGVDDLTARHGGGATSGTAVERALAGIPAGTATVLLSHTPVEIEAAARRLGTAPGDLPAPGATAPEGAPPRPGTGLMLSGHTHAGQIWPFNFLVGLRYPQVGGRHAIGGMTLIISRGAGTWGPRMRLWQRGEIVRIRLRSP